MDTNGNLRVEAGGTGKDTPEALDAPGGHETAALAALGEE